jgi:hypothetical protein
MSSSSEETWEGEGMRIYLKGEGQVSREVEIGDVSVLGWLAAHEQGYTFANKVGAEWPCWSRTGNGDAWEESGLKGRAASRLIQMGVQSASNWIYSHPLDVGDLKFEEWVSHLFRQYHQEQMQKIRENGERFGGFLSAQVENLLAEVRSQGTSLEPTLGVSLCRGTRIQHPPKGPSLQVFVNVAIPNGRANPIYFTFGVHWVFSVLEPTLNIPENLQPQVFEVDGVQFFQRGPQVSYDGHFLSEGTWRERILVAIYGEMARLELERARMKHRQEKLTRIWEWEEANG